jgi:BirA family biotin operon repressor/biotin-[acetyl-CoA-carboxylase] ligase
VTRELTELVYRFDSLASTNDTAKEMAAAGAIEGTTVVAVEQTAGRGRYDRQWFSPKGEGLYHSIILTPPIPAQSAPLLGFVAAIALAEVLIEEYNIHADIKWPNDVLANGKKLAGILLELEAEDDRIKYVVLGIGVNVNQSVFPDDLAERATSLRIETGMTFDCEKLRKGLFARLCDWYNRFLNDRSNVVLSRYSELSSYASGKDVRVRTTERIIVGRTVGLDSSGGLLVRTVDGRIELILSGDVQRLEGP